MLLLTVFEITTVKILTLCLFWDLAFGDPWGITPNMQEDT